MSNLPDNRKYTPSHVWASLNTAGLVTIGITDHVQESLGNITYIELPDVGSLVKATETCAKIASNYAVLDICAPVSGEVVETNQEAVESPSIVNADPFAAWLFRVKPDDAVDLDTLLDSASYLSSCLYFAE